MSSLNQGNNRQTLDLQSDSQPNIYNPAATSGSSVPIPTLPAYAYTIPTPKRPKVSAHADHNISSVHANGTNRSDSPDPHDFYRRHQDQYRAVAKESSGQADLRVERRGSNMAAIGQRSSPLTARSNAPKLPPLTSRIGSRYNAPTTTDRSPLSAAKSSPTLSNTARNRQTSLKDLVDKFNQVPDEALPLPKKPSSRSPSTSSNHRGSSNNVHVKPRNPSLSKDPVDDQGRDSSSTSLQSLDQSVGKTRYNLRNGRTHEDLRSNPRSKRGLKSQRTDPVHTTQCASQSTTNLGHHADDLSRRPLFGELLDMDPGQADPGFGIPKARRRRGSEGSMHSPNPMFPQERGRQMHDLSPSSPSAWYLGTTPTLEEIKADGHIPDLPAKIHRRTRSDFSGVPSRPPISNMYGTDVSPPRYAPSFPTSTTHSKRSSHSRIPISTARRQSTASDSGNSTTSTRASSAMGKTHIKPPMRPRASESKYAYPQNPLSPPKNSRSNTPQRSPRRGDFTSGIARPATSPRLTAYISAPLPKKSPPLRSSRPRQPVSSASTSASRARAVEKFSTHEGNSSRAGGEARPRKPPELAGVDFAARRQKIQQAVTQTVKEEKRKDEERRASMALSMISGLHVPDGNITAEIEDPPYSQSGDQRDEEMVDHQKDQNPQHEDAGIQQIEEALPKAERELTINTAHLSERSVLDLSMEDSPTLGTYHRFSPGIHRSQEGGESTSSDIEPSSAITAGTSDSVDTFFDEEPQDDSHSNSHRMPRTHEHQTPITQNQTTSDETQSPGTARQLAATEEPVSEVDDQESIQIMLGETPVLEKGQFNDQFHEISTEPQSSESRESRWSMSSWTSSTRSRDDREGPMERIDEHSPVQPVQPTHLSISTSGSQQTPQAWSPQSFSSLRTARTTMDSDAYSTVNRVLDHYHDPNIVSTELMHDVQQHVITQSPDLARQGGWDPKKVTALYLQELAKGRKAQTNSSPDIVKFQIRSRTSSIKIPDVPEKEVRDDNREKMVDSVEGEDQEATPPGTTLTVNQESSRTARASLTGPDDWDMSPSLGGLEMQAEAVDSPVEDKFKLPLKDWRMRSKLDLAEVPGRNQEQAPRPIDTQPQLPPIEGLGLDIKVVPPQSNDSPIIQSPPLPFHSPPPPPAEQPPPTVLRSPPSPSIYSHHSSIYPPANAASGDSVIPPLPSLPSLSNHDASSQSRTKTSAFQSTDSTSVSPPQERLVLERPSATADVASKNTSPSPDQKRLTKRRHIIKELVDTEHSFCQDMKVMDDIYRATATDFLLTVEDVKTLFGNLDQIINFSTEFLDALKQGSKSVYTLAKSKRWKGNRGSSVTSHSGNTDDQSSINGADLNDEEKDRKTFVGEAFGHHMACMEKVYTEYLKNHDSANQKLQVLQKDTTISVWLKECHTCAQDLTSAWDLDSLLVKPVQRILKYPLLLDQLVEVTPENHPDFTALDIAAREMKGMAKRIDETKKRADLMERVTNPRKRKESDVRIGLSKAFGRRTEKLRQQVGLSDMVEDKAYSAVSEKFGSHFFQLQVVMRDVEMYTNDVQIFMNRFCDFALAIEAHIEVSQTSYPEFESKWRKFRMSTREMSMTALTDHVGFSTPRLT